jgi:hypothetical protein
LDHFNKVSEEIDRLVKVGFEGINITFGYEVKTVFHSGAPADHIDYDGDLGWVSF